ncbi:MAG: undecaprenyl/decaprenyl-phosphate alpha-N-acetylglucosaminyl 1-phosphate transferase [Thermotogae bacterium]|nr:MAG: undecaprenyl/decaprenyl-phosphate alpha-N-acetylglucosaminyl 1-phosphate transferase [Thermotogota bacterium]
MGFVDIPDGVLKIHERVIPYLGGLGMFLGALPVLWKDSFSLVIVSLTVSLGLLDDIFRLNPFLRLSVEIVLSSAIVWRFVGFENPFYSFVLVVGFTGLLNAVNMIDGLDGICAGSVGIASLFFFFLSLDNFSKDLSLTTVAVCLGFLLYNFPPAKVFMGDAGSYLLGMLLSLNFAANNRVFQFERFLPSVLIVWFFALDLGASFLRRVKSGQSPFEGDRDHFYDKIFRRIKGDVLKRKRMTAFLTYITILPFPLLGILCKSNLTNLIVALVLALTYSILLVKTLNLFDYDERR